MHVKEALPQFAPKSFLDFGAGPGTATMAAGAVFASSAASFTLVEPSIAMQVMPPATCAAVCQRYTVQGVSKAMLAGLAGVTYLSSLSHAPSASGAFQRSPAALAPYSHALRFSPRT
jgi:hypothetical protein